MSVKIMRKAFYLIILVSFSNAVLGFAEGESVPGENRLLNKIVFYQDRWGKAICCMDLDGSAKTALVSIMPEEELTGFSLSPGGETLVYATLGMGKGAIYKADIGSEEKDVLVEDVFVTYGPVFSPDGNEILFKSNEPDSERVYTVRTDGTGLENITSKVPGIDYAVYSPDGKTVAFGWESKSENKVGLWDLKSGNVTYLPENGPPAYCPRFAPNNKLIAYLIREDDDFHLSVMDTAGKNCRRLVYDKPVGPLHYNFSPDCRSIAFMAEGDEWREAIYTIKVNGEDEKRLTYNQSRDGNPVYSPDGQFIAFESMAFDKTEIFIMKSDGTGLRRLTPDGHNRDPIFSPMLVGNKIIDYYGNKYPIER
jgi:TolB protein